MTVHTTAREAIADLAADSPITYPQIRDAGRAGTLGAMLSGLTSAQRVAAAAVYAERRQISLSEALDVFGRLMDEAELTELTEPTDPTPPARQPARPPARQLGGPDFAELSHLTAPAGSHITSNLADALRQIGADAELQALTEAALASIGVRCRLPIADVRVVRRWHLSQGQAVALSWWLRAQLQARDEEARPMGLDELGERLRVSVERFVGRLNSYAA